MGRVVGVGVGQSFEYVSDGLNGGGVFIRGRKGRFKLIRNLRQLI